MEDLDEGLTGHRIVLSLTGSDFAISDHRHDACDDANNGERERCTRHALRNR